MSGNFLLVSRAVIFLPGIHVQYRDCTYVRLCLEEIKYREVVAGKKEASVRIYGRGLCVRFFSPGAEWIISGKAKTKKFFCTFYVYFLFVWHVACPFCRRTNGQSNLTSFVLAVSRFLSTLLYLPYTELLSSLYAYAQTMYSSTSLISLVR